MNEQIGKMVLNYLEKTPVTDPKTGELTEGEQLVIILKSLGDEKEYTHQIPLTEESAKRLPSTQQMNEWRDKGQLVVLSALGFHGIPPISPTVVVVSLMFPLGSLSYGFVQQGKARKSRAELDEEKLSYEQEVEAEKHRAELAALKAQTRVNQAKGLAGMVRAGVQAARGNEEEASPEEEEIPANPQ